MSGTFPPAAAPSTLKGELRAFRVGSIPAGWTQVSGPTTGVSGYVPCELLPVPAVTPAGTVRLASSGGVLYMLTMESTPSSVYKFERFEPATGTWTTLPVPNTGVAPATTAPLGPLITLPSGRLLFASVSAATAIAAARLYDPALNAWLPAANMPSASGGGGGALLSNGTAYVCGSGATGYAYDEVTNTWATKAKNPLQSTSSASGAYASLGDGRLLAISGSTYHIYTEATDTWGAALTAQNGVIVGSATPLLKAGSKLLSPTGNGITADTVMRVFDIPTATWSVSTEQTIGAAGPDAAQLSDGTWCWGLQPAGGPLRRLVRRATTALPTAIVWAVKDE